MRLTLLYSSLFLAAGAGLLAVTYLLVRSVPSGKVDSNLLFFRPKPNAPAGSPPGKVTKLVRPTSDAIEQKLAELQQLKAQSLDTHAIDMHEFLMWSGIALAIMAVLAVGLGWLVAGRVLRPLRTMTASTQRITEHNLHERLALRGPSDEVKDLADTIDGLLHRLESAFDAQRRFVANASHELRTPLTLDRALLEITLTNPEASNEDLRAMGQELLASAEQQERLVEALLTLATTARGLERHEPFDLAELVTAVLAVSHPEADELGLRVQTTLASAPAVGDPLLAERLVSNLVDNALRHNVAGGHVVVATRTGSGRAVLAVTNSGPVIPPEHMDRLFQPFQRLDSDRLNHVGGHGLGLSIVQSIADAHGATVTTRAELGGGLSIEVAFPLSPREQALGARTPVESTFAG